MTELPITLAMVGRLLRHRWPFLVALVVLGALLGFGASFVLSPGYVSTSKVLLQGSRDAKEIAGETDIATSVVVLDKVAAALGDGRTGVELQRKVSAGLDGNVITVSAAAGSPEQAQRLADQATKQYVAFSTQIISDSASAAADASRAARDALQQRLDEANARITQLQASPDLDAAGAAGQTVRDELQRQRTTVGGVTSSLQQLDAATSNATVNASMSTSSALIIEPAILPAGLATPTPVQLIAGGGLVALLLGVLGHLLAVRLDRRLRGIQDIGSALGAPVLGTLGVEVPPVRRSLRGRLLHDDRRWAVPPEAVTEDDRGRRARWDRVLHRFRQGDLPSSWLVLAADDDAVGRALAVDLVAALAAAGPVVVRADGPLREAIGEAADRHGVADDVTVVDPDEIGPVVAGRRVRAVCVHVAHPVVPDALSFETGPTCTVVVLGLGTRSAWDLAALATTCIDAGHEITGALAGVATVVTDVPRPAAEKVAEKPGTTDPDKEMASAS